MKTGAAVRPLTGQAWATEERIRKLEEIIEFLLNGFYGHRVLAGYHEHVAVSATENRYTIYFDNTKARKLYEEIVISSAVAPAETEYKTVTFFDNDGQEKHRFILTSFVYSGATDENYVCKKVL